MLLKGGNCNFSTSSPSVFIRTSTIPRRNWIVFSLIYFSFLSEKPQKWRVEINSGQKKVKTVWQLSDSPPVDHLNFHRPGKDGL